MRLPVWVSVFVPSSYMRALLRSPLSLTPAAINTVPSLRSVPVCEARSGERTTDVLARTIWEPASAMTKHESPITKFFIDCRLRDERAVRATQNHADPRINPLPSSSEENKFLHGVILLSFFGLDPHR